MNKVIVGIMSLLIITSSRVFAHEDGDDHHMGDWDGHMTDFGPVSIFMWTMMSLWIVLIVVGIYYFATSSKRKSNEKNPLKILKKRYAKGKITRDEFERMKQDLKS
jgi:putative membrane protein